MQHSPQTKQSGREPKPRGVLMRLAKDQRGSTLAIGVAAIIPMMGMVGSAVDISRAYMAQNRLQQACDAGVIAGRKVYTLDAALAQGAAFPNNGKVKTEVQKYVNFNFPQETLGTEAFTITPTLGATQAVDLNVATRVPTSIMGMFGFRWLPIEATCTAREDYVNTDIVLVLDTTGSMLEDVNGASTTVVANQKITALRAAVMAFYDELTPVQTQLTAAGLRLRYGIVPYSSTVNVGKIVYDANPAYIADRHTYQSRRPTYTTTYPTTTSTQNFTDTDQAACNTRVQARTPASGYPATAKSVAWNNSRKRCTVTTTTYDILNTHSGWSHEAIEHPTDAFKATVSTQVGVPVPSRTPGTTFNDVWSGCIEERQSVPTITSSSGYTPPSGASDLDLDTIPTSDATKWKPHWPEVEYFRTDNDAEAFTPGGGEDYQSDTWWLVNYASSQLIACPSPAKRLQAWTRADMNTYLNSLIAVGYTYHDIGMIWGGRLISSAGIFGADNPDTFNGFPVRKYVIFMTDGALNTVRQNYSAYGLEYIDGRVGGTDNANLTERHRQRFKMMCNAVKGKDVSVWVVAFATATESSMSECASNSSQFSYSANQADLIARFKKIGEEIGALRLSR